MRARAADPSRAGDRDGHLEAHRRRERAPADARPGWSRTPASGPRRPGPRPGRLVLRPRRRRRRRAGRQHRARGVVAECVDAHGETVSRAAGQLGRPAPARAGRGRALRTAAEDARPAAGAAPRLAVVSAADPVDRATGRLVHLPDAPFLLGELDPVEVLRPHVDGPVIVDNDVNWAARAERDARRDAGRLRLPLPRRGARLRDRQRRRGPARAPRARRRDRPPRHRRSGRPGDPAHRGVRRARPAPARLDRDRRRPAPGRGQRPGSRGGAPCGGRWATLPAACSPPSSRSPTRRPSSSAGRGAATPSSSTRSRRRSTDSPPRSRPGRPAHRRAVPGRRPRRGARPPPRGDRRRGPGDGAQPLVDQGASDAASSRCPRTRAASRSSGHLTIRYDAGIPASCSAYQHGLLVLPTRRQVPASTGSSRPRRAGQAPRPRRPAARR